MGDKNPHIGSSFDDMLREAGMDNIPASLVEHVARALMAHDFAVHEDADAPQDVIDRVWPDYTDLASVAIATIYKWRGIDASDEARMERDD